MGLCFDDRVMMSPAMPSSVVPTSNFGASWDPLVGLNGEEPKTELDEETHLGWDMIQGHE